MTPYTSAPWRIDICSSSICRENAPYAIRDIQRALREQLYDFMPDSYLGLSGIIQEWYVRLRSGDKSVPESLFTSLDNIEMSIVSLTSVDLLEILVFSVTHHEIGMMAMTKPDRGLGSVCDQVLIHLMPVMPNDFIAASYAAFEYLTTIGTAIDAELPIYNESDITITLRPCRDHSNQKEPILAMSYSKMTDRGRLVRCYGRLGEHISKLNHPASYYLLLEMLRHPWPEVCNKAAWSLRAWHADDLVARLQEALTSPDRSTLLDCNFNHIVHLLRRRDR